MTVEMLKHTSVGAVGAVGDITTPEGKKKVNVAVGVKRSVTGEDIFAMQVGDIRIEIPYEAVKRAAKGTV